LDVENSAAANENEPCTVEILDEQLHEYPDFHQVATSTTLETTKMEGAKVNFEN